MDLPFDIAGVIELEGALCAKFDPRDWMPEHESDYHPGGTVDQAIEVCGRCPAIAKCLAMALAAETSPQGTPLTGKMRYGIYGGMTAQQRADHARGEVA